VPFMASAYSSLGNGLAHISGLLENISREDEGECQHAIDELEVCNVFFH
jgi:hypothetical protein